MTTVQNEKPGIGLALSGGGVRAAAFHAGVLQYLAEQGKLEDVTHISSVSGGSLFIGLVYSSNSNAWPDSQRYLEVSLPRVRELLTTTCLQSNAFSRLLIPSNWRFLLSRANVVAQTIGSLWGVSGVLRDIGEKPNWSINGTTAETGKRCRFKAGQFGDYLIGYADAHTFPLTEALAVSAAFPGGVGPLTIKTNDFKWHKKREWDSGEAEEVVLNHNRLHLYDGGVYDNLGLEPLFDVGRQRVKPQAGGIINQLFVSDAGAPLPNTAIPNQLHPSRFKRLADIMSDQTRAIRVRALVNYLQCNAASGAYIMIGSEAVKSLEMFGATNEVAKERLLGKKWLSLDESRRAKQYPTNLKKMSGDTFDLLVQHGYETAMWNCELFSVFEADNSLRR